MTTLTLLNNTFQTATCPSYLNSSYEPQYCFYNHTKANPTVPVLAGTSDPGLIFGVRQDTTSPPGSDALYLNIPFDSALLSNVEAMVYPGYCTGDDPSTCPVQGCASGALQCMAGYTAEPVSDPIPTSTGG